MNIEQLYQLYLKYPAISTDTRKITPKSLFFALKGDHYDANQFAEQALELGAASVIVDDLSVIKNYQYVLVENCLQSLQELAKYHRTQMPAKIIGLTGTNGKTTTKELIASVLRESFNVHYTQGNLNNHIGVPLTLLQITKNHDFGIIEMGANHIGEIATLCNMVLPDFGLISNIGKAHIEGFGSFEGVIKAKSELYASLSERKCKAFVNAENSLLMDLCNSFNLEQIKYGNNSDCFLNAALSDSDTYLNLILNTNEEDKQISISTKLVGGYNLENAMAACTIGRYFGINDKQIKHALENYEPANNRSQLMKTAINQLVLDLYNANPSSMHASISNFIKTDNQNRVLILGDMLELGDTSNDEHKAILKLLQSKNISQIFLVGTFFSKASEELSTNFNSFKDVLALNDYLSTHKIIGKTILLKGSRGIKLETLIPSL